MNIQYKDQFIKISSNPVPDCIELVGKSICEDYVSLKRLIKIINLKIEKSQATKIIFSLENISSLSYSNLITKELFQSIAKLGIQTIAIITGYDKNVKVFFDEYDQSLIPIKKAYSFETKQFLSINEGLRWIAKK